MHELGEVAVIGLGLLLMVLTIGALLPMQRFRRSYRNRRP
jgi:hypothetical protein